MRKLLLLLITLTFITFAQAQETDLSKADLSEYLIPFDTVTKEWKHQEDVAVVGSTKDDLFSKAKAWGVKTYADYKSMVKLEDATEGKIILKGVQQVNKRIFEARVSYTVTIECKDNKYRCTIDDLLLEEKLGEWIATGPSVSNSLLKSDWKELHDESVSEKKKESTKISFIIRKDINENTNSTIQTILSSLKKEMVTKDEACSKYVYLSNGSVASKKPITLSAKNGSGVSIVVLLDKETIIISIDMKGKKGCITENDKVLLAFEDNSFLLLDNHAKSNCEGHFVHYIDKSVGTLKNLDALSTKLVKELTMLGKNNNIELEVLSVDADFLKSGLNCMKMLMIK